MALLGCFEFTQDRQNPEIMAPMSREQTRQKLTTEVVEPPLPPFFSQGSTERRGGVGWGYWARWSLSHQPMRTALAPTSRKLGLAGNAPSPHFHPKSRAAKHLTSDERRRDDLLLDSPQQLLERWYRDREGLLWRVEQVLRSEDLRKRMRLGPSDVKLPIQLAPFNPAIDPRSGELGFACIVVPPTESYTKNTGAWSVNPVRTPPPPPILTARLPSSISA